MTAFFRRFKFAYAVYNLFHRKELIYNTALFKRYGLKKRYFSPVSSKDFRNVVETQTMAGEKPPVEESEIFRNSSAENQQSILSFDKHGFLGRE